MKNTTRKNYNAYTQQIAALNDVEDATVKFNVTPSVQQTLETRMQESSTFLSQINMAGVDEQSGAKIGLGIDGTVAKRTSNANLPRQPIDPSTLDEDEYFCKFTEFDTSISYQKLDQWAKFPDFQKRVRDAILKRQALDRIMIGFNGTSAAAHTDRATNPMLQDVNIGWLEKYRTKAPARVLSEVVPSSGKIDVGAGGDYENLDALVMDCINNLIEPWYQEDTGLVAICGRQLLADKYFPLVNQQNPATETLATDVIISQKRLGGVGAARVPFFPANAILVTSLENLSIYWQEGARRRYMKEEPESNRIANYESSNDAYVVEDYGFGCLIENINIL